MLFNGRQYFKMIEQFNRQTTNPFPCEVGLLWPPALFFLQRKFRSTLNLPVLKNLRHLGISIYHFLTDEYIVSAKILPIFGGIILADVM